jgi:hypothetical protein
VIVSEQELAHIKGKAKALWVPVTYGTYYEEGRTEPVRRPHACPLKPESKRGLQLAPFTPTLLTITITDATIVTIAQADPRPAGYKFLAQARAAYDAKYGPAGDDTQIWVVRFEVGDLTPLYENLQERYLKRTMGGARDYTTNAGLAIRGEGCVPREDEMRFAASAAAKRRVQELQERQSALRDIREAIATLDDHDLDKEDREMLRWMRRRAAKLAEKLKLAAAA